MSTSQLHVEHEQAVAEAASLYQRIKAQATRDGDRPFTPSECQTLQTAIDRATTLKRRLGESRSDQSLLTEITRLTDGMIGGTVGGRSIGAQFLNSAAGQWLQANKVRGSRWETPIVEIDDPRRLASAMRATTITSDPTSGGVAVPPQYLPGIVPVPLRPPVVADLLSDGQTSSNAIVYLKETAYTVAAAAVAEAASKPESAITFTQQTDKVEKLAHWLPVTDELLEDVPAMGSYIDTRLMQGLQVVEDDQLLNGNGTAPNLAGLLMRATAPDVPAGTDTNADAIAKQMAAIQTATNLVPTGTIINPKNWLTIVLSKNLQGGYFGAGPFMPMQAWTLWGKPVAVTTAIPVGTALVVCGQAATVFRRGGINVQASNSHQDFFIKNLTAIRAEERVALAVMIPAAFGKVTGLI